MNVNGKLASLLDRMMVEMYRTHLNQVIYGNTFWRSEMVVPVAPHHYDQFRGLYPLIYPEAEPGPLRRTLDAQSPRHRCDRCPSDGPCPADTGRPRKGQ